MNRRASLRMGYRLMVVGTSAAVVLTVLGSRVAVPLPAPDDLRRWLDTTDPAAILSGLGRGFALALAALVIGLGSLHVLAALAPSPQVRHWVARVTPRTFQLVVGLSVTAPVGPVGADEEPAPPTPTVVMVDVTPADGPSPATTESVTMTHLDGRRQTPATDTEWRVEPGDHLWGIAEETLTDHLGRSPTDVEIEPYWRRLIAANRDRLVNPGDADLILPGQVFVLPPPA